jgi:hypothetical protein
MGCSPHRDLWPAPVKWGTRPTTRTECVRDDYAVAPTDGFRSVTETRRRGVRDTFAQAVEPVGAATPVERLANYAGRRRLPDT